ncbi:N-acetylglutaminylglutamine amidotransferase [Permianibacter aggregans]|uniref:asparagine synthase (glutamine-hydrolyzing) n=1 Tax=Permianibacter aggregans TaxID=1510150 RepID=A0A4R6UFA7_9GAMM|nr:N-acetylglutaminylglutamine amidotransferase [Permianibacter aggregans]QGX39653.1 N-acetylglutaminylglutamine amidotransferase [Permianibacter aggregans]TDQ45441.1 asparagine synthase (glutamine-hydrolysing) [Permianibacter aggregans]
MCGIAGEIRFDGRMADIRTVTAMTETMADRGPDSNGYFTQGPRAFGHQRLRIMDLSERSHQPFIDTDLGLGVVFNGAIYNHPQLRIELKNKGYNFVSTGDTEVIIKAWHCWGEKALDRLQGMFAFCLWERDTGRSILVRDRLGIKPLYYSQTGDHLHFASSLKALLKVPGVNTDLDPVALHRYLSFHAVVPAPHTIYQGIKKLPPATMMIVERDGATKEKTWWNLSFERGEADLKRSDAEWQELTLEAMRTAVRRRLVADVPVGVLLSGGVDSSLITGLLAEEGVPDLRTYSIGFEAVNGEAGDEFEYSRTIAQHFQTDHQEIFIPSRDIPTALPQAIAAMNEPMVSHDCVAFYLLSREVSKRTRVVQSGQGADEVFGGYHWYPPMLEARHPVDDYHRVFADRDHTEMTKLLTRDFLQDDYSRAYIEQHFNQPGATDAVDKALRIDTTVMLVDDPVKRVDNMTMAFGLEARVPFLDHEVVELAARMPAMQKINHGGKYVLKEAARKVIPASVIDRPKGYFPVPALKYLKGAMLDIARERLMDASAKTAGVFQRDYVEHLLDDPGKHITPLRGSKLWQLTLLEWWLDTHQASA